MGRVRHSAYVAKELQCIELQREVAALKAELAAIGPVERQVIDLTAENARLRHLLEIARAGLQSLGAAA